MVAGITSAERARLNELVAKSVGFRPEKVAPGCWRLLQPDGKPTESRAAFWSGGPGETWTESPDFTCDMADVHKWLLPWLGNMLRKRDRGDRWRIQTSLWEDIVFVDAEHLSGGLVHEEGPLCDLPLLLCRVVERLGDRIVEASRG
ncbi:MAG: hypothetical protein V2A73_08770 [Pseudomonadota bacterium]